MPTSSVSWPVVVTWSKWVFKRVLCELQGSSLLLCQLHEILLFKWFEIAFLWHQMFQNNLVHIIMLATVFKNTWSHYLVSVYFWWLILAPILFCHNYLWHGVSTTVVRQNPHQHFCGLQVLPVFSFILQERYGMSKKKLLDLKRIVGIWKY